VPWKILATASGFLNFMSAYSVFLGPIAAILVWDFWWVHKMKYNVVALYHPEGYAPPPLPRLTSIKTLMNISIYRYTFGVNFRALLAFTIGVAPNLPGFIHSINPSINVGVGSRPYTFAWLLGFVITSLIYVVLSMVWPPTESMIPRAVLPDEVYEGEAGAVIEGKTVVDEEVGKGSGEESWKKEEGELRVM